MTRKSLTIVLASIVLVFAASGAQATIITIDPDAFAAGTDLSVAFPGVTLSVDGPGYPSSGPVRAVTPSLFVATTGSLTFGHDGGFPDVWREPGFLNLRVDFGSPVQWVAIDVMADDLSDFGHLRAFGPGDVLLGTVTTAQLTTGTFATMSFSAPSISYVLVGGLDSGSAVGLDNLQYEAVRLDPAHPGARRLLDELQGRR
jgi:hypothetical protein